MSLSYATAGATAPSCLADLRPLDETAPVPGLADLAMTGGESVSLAGVLLPGDPGLERIAAYRADARALIDDVLAEPALRFLAEKGEPGRWGLIPVHVLSGRAGGEQTWLQGRLVSQGLALADARPGVATCGPLLLRLEREARAAERGLWQATGMRVLDAARPAEVHPFKGQWALVRGRVHGVTRIDRRVFINFGEDWREDVTLVVHPKDRRLVERLADGLWGMPLEGLEGRWIEARGFVVDYRGPQIEIAHPLQVEVMPHDDIPDDPSR